MALVCCRIDQGENSTAKCRGKVPGMPGVSKLAYQGSAEFPREIGFWHYSVPIFKIQNMCVYYYILKVHPE